MNSSKIDRRVTRTRKLLKQALLEVIVRHGYAETTVQDIINHAGVGRSTFYAHFKNKDELLYSGLPNSVLLFGENYDRDTLVPSIAPFLQHVDQQKAVLRALVGRHSSVVSRKRITERSYESWRRHFAQLAKRGHALPAPTDIMAHYFNGAMMSLVIWWVDNSGACSSTEVANTFNRITERGFSAIVPAT